MIVYFRDSNDNVWRRIGRCMWYHRVVKNYVYLFNKVDNGWMFNGYYDHGAMPTDGGKLTRITEEDAFAQILEEELQQ